MKPIAPSLSQFEVIRGIAAAGFDYETTNRLCSEVGWELTEDEPDLGFVQYFLCVGPDGDDQRLLSVGTPQLAGTPHIYLPLFYFPEHAEGGDPQKHDRTPFDIAYRCLSDSIGAMLGKPHHDGEYECPHRPGWRYNYCVWRVPEAKVILLQDEHDIQFGMDVSLWLFPPALDISVPLPY